MTENRKHWFTNGKDEILSETCPDGWHSGRAPISDEIKRKHRENNGIHKLTEEQKLERAKKIKEARANWTQEQREAFSLKMSQSRKGKGTGKDPWNKGLKTNQPAWNRGLKQSEEKKQNLRNSYLNLTEEERRRRSEAISSANKGKVPWNKGKRYKLPKDVIIKAKLKEYNTKKLNNTFITSGIEEVFYGYLVNIFGKDSIKRQYRETIRYPFNCDFYVIPLDLFIELNINWTHGGRPYVDNEECNLILDSWEQKAKDSDYYKNAIYTWTDLDVRKNEFASKYKLNYVRLYNNNDVEKFIQDITYRFNLIVELQKNGFPTYNCSNEDCLKQYQSLIDCEADTLSNNKKYCNRLIKFIHTTIFKSNRVGKLSPSEAFNDIKLLNKVIENRIKYVGNEISLESLVRGFSISGIAPKVSVFNPYISKYIVNKYLSEFDSVFDPCSGFSGRMLGTCSLGKRYIGQDINASTVNESNNLISILNLNATITVKNSIVDEGDYECLFTCPPYGNKERWNQDIEILSCDEWIDVCLRNYKCNRYVFVVDETEKYKDYIVETISNKSHLNSSKEYIVVIDIV